MRNLFAVAALATGLSAAATPASAQYFFDFRWDPQQCSWRDICDYGGRAYRAYAVRRALCPIVDVERRLPDGSVVIDRRRQCNVVRVRG